MRAFQLTGIRCGELCELPPPGSPGPGEVLLRIHEVGVCGSDLHYYRTGRIGDQVVDFPFIVGHECSGEVLAVGEGVTRVAVGDMVAVDPSVSCGECDQCAAGREHTCRRNMFLGCPGQLSGALTDLLVMPQECCHRLTPGMTATQGVMSEPLAIAVYTAREFLDPRGCSIGVLGCGPIGRCVIETMRAYGAASIYATELLPCRMDATRGKADWAGHPDELSSVLTKMEPTGLDVVVECCGSQQAITQAIDVLKPGGALLMVGIPEEDTVAVPVHLARRKEVRLFNVRRQRGCVAEALRLLADKQVDVECLVTHRFPLEQAGEAFDLVEGYRGGAIKAIIELSSGPAQRS